MMRGNITKPKEQDLGGMERHLERRWKFGMMITNNSREVKRRNFGINQNRGKKCSVSFFFKSSRY